MGQGNGSCNKAAPRLGLSLSFCTVPFRVSLGEAMRASGRTTATTLCVCVSVCLCVCVCLLPCTTGSIRAHFTMPRVLPKIALKYTCHDPMATARRHCPEAGWTPHAPFGRVCCTIGSSTGWTQSSIESLHRRWYPSDWCPASA